MTPMTPLAPLSSAQPDVLTRRRHLSEAPRGSLSEKVPH